MSDNAADQIGNDLLQKSETNGSSPALPFSCNADMWVKIDLSMDPASKLAKIEWSMSENYPTSTPPKGHSGPTIALYQDDELLRETSVDKRIGSWLTDQPFAPELNARVFDWDCRSKSHFPLCKTKTPPSSDGCSQSCKADMSVQIDLSMDPASKNALIAWSISDSYPTSTFPEGHCGPTIALYQADQLLKEILVDERAGSWPTEQLFGPGLNARISDWDRQSKSRLLLCKTPSVP